MDSGKWKNPANGGMSLLDCKRAVRAAGGSVLPVRGTGEIVFWCEELGSSGAINNRKKDAPRHAITWLRRLQQLKKQSD
jgi:hypothetical protein